MLSGVEAWQPSAVLWITGSPQSHIRRAKKKVWYRHLPFDSAQGDDIRYLVKLLYPTQSQRRRVGFK